MVGAISFGPFKDEKCYYLHHLSDLYGNSYMYNLSDNKFYRCNRLGNKTKIAHTRFFYLNIRRRNKKNLHSSNQLKTNNSHYNKKKYNKHVVLKNVYNMSKFH